MKQQNNFSFSYMCNFMRSPAHAEKLKLLPYETTAQQYWNLAIECAIQEPDRFKQEYIIHRPDPKTKSIKATKLWKEDNAKHPGKVLTPDEYDRITQIVDNFFEDLDRASLYGDGHAQHDFQWQVSGIKCRGFADWLSEEHKTIADIKIVANASDDLVELVTNKKLYFVQAAMYRHAAEIEGLDIDYSLLIYIEDKYPFESNIRELSDSYLDIGHNIYMEQLYKFKKCVENGNFPSYTKFKAMAPPSYMMRKHLEQEYYNE